VVEQQQKLKKFGLILLLFGLGGAVIVFFVVMERRLWSDAAAEGPLVLAEKPLWVSDALVSKIYQAVGGRSFALHEGTIVSLDKQLASVAWLSHRSLQVTGDRLLLRGQWRRPIARVHSGTTKFFVDANGVVLDDVPLPGLPLVTIRGVRVTRMPPLGEVLEREDAKAAVALVSLLDWMDRKTVPNKPLLQEIERVDVSNFGGRTDRKAPHILFYAKDGTPIRWGAAMGTWAQHLEASDEEKLARLYTYYRKRGTVQGGVMYVDLREPREIPQPTLPQPAPNY
jgi:hypothetical protein